jgi:hypothetical protein
MGASVASDALHSVNCIGGYLACASPDLPLDALTPIFHNAIDRVWFRRIRNERGRRYRQGAHH